MKNSLLVVLVLNLLLACQPSQNNSIANDDLKKEMNAPIFPTEHHSSAISKVFDVHGGFEKWSSMKRLSYKKGDEMTVTNIHNRKIRVETVAQTIGFDGENVWVTPDSVDASRARFYHNLFFYFYAMPFVVGDPGVFYEDMQPRELQGKTYGGVKISYDNGIGDSPNDNYIVWYNPETYSMEWLMYTVTYGGEGSNNNYKLIKYNQWDTYEGLALPKSIQWYDYQNDTVGEMINEVVFEDIRISKSAPDEKLFEMPENAQIAIK